MPCLVIEIEPGFTAMICGVPAPQGKACFYCGKHSEFLCDYPVIGKPWLGIKTTCDRALCRRCAMKGVSETVDFCRAHYELAKAAYERRVKNAQ